MVNCPKCNAVIDVDEEELDAGDGVSCDECAANFTVDSTDPLELVPEDEDDDDEDDDLDDDDDEFDEDEDDDDEDDDEDEDWK
jgi:alpha-aminoadipate/glutamate carrier protein LysW